jgi:hypothetical protein
MILQITHGVSGDQGIKTLAPGTYQTIVCLFLKEYVLVFCSFGADRWRESIEVMQIITSYFYTSAFPNVSLSL